MYRKYFNNVGIVIALYIKSPLKIHYFETLSNPRRGFLYLCPNRFHRRHEVTEGFINFILALFIRINNIKHLSNLN